MLELINATKSFHRAGRLETPLRGATMLLETAAFTALMAKAAKGKQQLRDFYVEHSTQIREAQY
jgi:hypothetical protein